MSTGRGWTVAIGGAEDQHGERTILRRFVTLCGGSSARIAVIPTAAKRASRGEDYAEVFQDLGAGEVRSLPFRKRADCSRADWLEFLDSAAGVFLTGGGQVRLSTTLGGTAVAGLLHRRHRQGQHIGGTSAGAAILSQHMIASGGEGSTPHAGMVTLAPGLGFTDRAIIDQHFRQRDRLGRLLAALAYNPAVYGVGLDEDTAAFISPDDEIEVVGSGAITIVDPTEMEHAAMNSTRNLPVSAIGVRLHVLIEGATFHLQTGKAGPPPSIHP